MRFFAGAQTGSDARPRHIRRNDVSARRLCRGRYLPGLPQRCGQYRPQLCGHDDKHDLIHGGLGEQAMIAEPS